MMAIIRLHMIIGVIGAVVPVGMHIDMVMTIAGAGRPGYTNYL